MWRLMDALSSSMERLRANPIPAAEHVLKLQRNFAVAAVAMVFAAACTAQRDTSPNDGHQIDGGNADPVDIVVIGAGISGIAAAIEAADRGASVIVVDRWSVFGGHAVMSHGGLCIVDTPLQRSLGISDSTELAIADFLSWGRDADAAWVDYYSRNSSVELYEWLTDMGVNFTGVIWSPGNTVARFHEPECRGLGLVLPMYRKALQNPRIRFVWNVDVNGIASADRGISGISGTDMRTNDSVHIPSRSVIIATGGFQSNLDLVRKYWKPEWNLPSRMLAGSGINSMGSGLRLAESTGADLHRLDHQWNYATGLPDPRSTDRTRGLNASNAYAIWVNSRGQRFVNENASTVTRFPAVLDQPNSTYWQVFDESSKDRFAVSGSGWSDFARIQQLILDDSTLVKRSNSLRDLAEQIGAPADNLVDTVTRYNAFVKSGQDLDFGRFEKSKEHAKLINSPPYYAVQFYPLARKSMGGIRIDSQARVLDEDGMPINGLFAVGEASGFGGINGSAALEGTFLGPGIITGRVAARSALAELPIGQSERDVLEHLEFLNRETTELHQAPQSDKDCENCHQIGPQITASRPGFEHFENVHSVVLERQFSCRLCHSEVYAPSSRAHSTDPMNQSNACQFCH